MRKFALQNGKLIKFVQTEKKSDVYNNKNSNMNKIYVVIFDCNLFWSAVKCRLIQISESVVKFYALDKNFKPHI